MVELYFKELKNKWFLLFLISLGVMVYLYNNDYMTSGVLFDCWIVYGNYVTIIVNNAFIVFCISRIRLIQNIYNLCAVRINKNSLINKLLIIGFIEVGIYIILFLIFGISMFSFVNSFIGFFAYLMIYFVLFMIYEMVYIVVVLDKRLSFLLICPFIINLVIHYIFILT